MVARFRQESSLPEKTIGVSRALGQVGKLRQQAGIRFGKSIKDQRDSSAHQASPQWQGTSQVKLGPAKMGS